MGGTGEVLLPGHAWPVPVAEGPDEAQGYVVALREVLAEPEEARQRARGLRERLLAERTAEAYAEQALALLLPAPAETGDPTDVAREQGRRA